MKGRYKVEEYKSLNFETGMLDDVDEIRRFGVDVAQTLQELLKLPPLRLLAYSDTFQALAVYAVKAESYFRFMSQREQYRLICKLTGTPDAEADALERQLGGLSDTLPGSHPQALENAMRGVQASDLPSDVKQRMEKGYEESMSLFRSQQKTELPGNIEKFLNELAKRPGNLERLEE